MKIWGIVIGVIFICAMVSSPALAISKNDLIAKYQSMNMGVVPADLCGSCGTPTTIPTPAPLPTHEVIEPPPDWFGSLSVESDPAGARVYLDGIYQGTTPIIISGVSASYYPCDGCIGYPATHAIKLTKTGYKDFITDGSVTKGETMSISATLIPIPRTLPSWFIPPGRPLPTIIPTTIPTPAPTPATPGTGIVSISSYPEGAMIYLDGAFKGYSPITLTGVPVGGHQIRMTMAGLPDYSNSVWVVAGVPASVVATFTSAKGDIIAGYGVDLPPCKSCQPILEG